MTEQLNTNEAADGRSDSTDVLERQRKEFEAWWVERHNPTNSFHPAAVTRFEKARDGGGVGEYMMLYTAGAWDAWQELSMRSN